MGDGYISNSRVLTSSVVLNKNVRRKDGSYSVMLIFYRYFSIVLTDILATISNGWLRPDGYPFVSSTYTMTKPHKRTGFTHCVFSLKSEASSILGL